MGTRVGIGAVAVACALLGLAIAGVFAPSGERVATTGALDRARKPPTPSTTTTTPGPDLAVPAPTSIPGGVATGGPGDVAIADTGGRTATGSGASSRTSTTQAPRAKAAPRPSTTTTPRPPAPSSCGSTSAVGRVTSFAVVQQADDEDYYVSVAGTVCNGTSAAIELFSVDLGYYDASGRRVDSGSVDLSGTLAPGQSRSWSATHELVFSANGPPTHAAVTRVSYD